MQTIGINKVTFVKKCGIILILSVICFKLFAETITIYNPDGTIIVCEVNKQTGTMYCI